MIKLLQNEIIKLLKKKSFYIVTVIFVLFCLLTNVVYKLMPQLLEEETISVEEIIRENEYLDLTNNEDLLIYVENLTILKMEELKEEYSTNTQAYLIENNLYSTIYNMYEAEYILADEDLASEYAQILEEEITHLDDWEYFLEERIEYLEARVEATTGIEQLRYQNFLSYALYRQEHGIAYDSTNYLHNALVFLEENNYEYTNLVNAEELTSEEESRLEYLEKEVAIRKYILEAQEDVLNEATLRMVLINFSGEFGLFILIYVIMLAGSIVSEEYTRGTIKYLLIKPYKRGMILTSKLLVVLLFIPLIMVFMSLIEIVIGGIVLGFDSLSVPVVLFLEGSIKTYPIIGYLATVLLSVMPMYIIIAMVAFLLSTITQSTSAAITVSFLFYLLGNVISNLALLYDFSFFKGFVSLYWDFSYLITKDVAPYGNSVGTSILVLSIYFLVIVSLTYVYFQKKDVKNV